MDTNVIEQIRKRAHEIHEYNKHNCVWLIFDGFVIRGRTAQDDWLQAEKEILAQNKRG